jgi:hypothetical protein
MPKLNQIIAVESSIKASSQKDLTDAYHAVQKPELMKGIARTYTPKDVEGDQLPPENTRVQVTAIDILRTTEQVMSKLLNITATKDWANCGAVASIVVDEKTVLAHVPATYLIFLEKRLVDLQTVVKTIPTLDPTEHWTFDASQACFASDPSTSVRTKKLPRNHVKYEATKEHPAQVEIFTEDIIVGTWRTIKYSGALPVVTKQAILDRLTKLLEAVKFAREEANSIEALNKWVGKPIFDYLLAPMHDA